MRATVFFIIVLNLFGFSAKADNVDNEKVVSLTELQALFAQDADITIIGDTIVEGKRKVKFQRGKAIIFCLFTGILGGHRIYFGTHQRTPIIYSVTLGGFGILPLVDLIHIIFTKDLSKFENTPEIIMWGK